MLTGKEELIQQIKQDPTWLDAPLAKDILGDDYTRIKQEVIKQDNPEDRNIRLMGYALILKGMGYSPQDIKSMTEDQAKMIIVGA